MNVNAVLHLEPRDPQHKELMRERGSGSVPGVLYGVRHEPVLVQVTLRALQAALARGAEHHPVSVRVGGEERTQLAVIKELQRDKYTQRPIHVDFMLVTNEEVIGVEVPVIVHGEAALVERGLQLLTQMHTISVRGRAGQLPDAFPFDASALHDGDSVTVADLHVGPGVIVLDPPARVIFSVGHARVRAEAPKE